MADHQEARHAGRCREYPAEDDRIEPPAQIRDDQHGEYQIAHQQWLDQCKRAVPEGDYLEHEPGHAPADRYHPQRLAHQVQQDLR